MLGYDFHRQKPIGNYIVDFFCNELSLAIEVGGESHYGNEKKMRKDRKKLKNMVLVFFVLMRV